MKAFIYATIFAFATASQASQTFNCKTKMIDDNGLPNGMSVFTLQVEGNQVRVTGKDVGNETAIMSQKGRFVSIDGDMWSISLQASALTQGTGKVALTIVSGASGRSGEGTCVSATH